MFLRRITVFFSLLLTLFSSNAQISVGYIEGTHFYVLKKMAGVHHPAKEYHGTLTILK